MIALMPVRQDKFKTFSRNFAFIGYYYIVNILNRTVYFAIIREELC